MGKTNVYVALDVGSFTTKLIACRIGEEKQMPIGVVCVPTKGIFKNKVNDENLLVKTIEEAIFKMNTDYQIKVQSVGFVIPTKEFSYLQHENEMIFDEPTLIQGKHLRDLEVSMYEKLHDTNEEITVVSIIPKKFILDNSLESFFPLNINVQSLRFQADVYGVHKNELYPYLSAIEKSGLKVVHLLPSVIASSYAALMKDEVVNGTCILDIGSDSTTLAIFSNRKVSFLEEINFGSHQLTKLIEKTLSIPYDAADLLKKHILATVNFMHSDNVESSIISFLKQKCQTEENAQKLILNINEKLKTFLNDVKSVIEENELENNFNYYVLTGGGSQIYDFEKYSKHILGKKCYISNPKYEGARHPMYTNAVGMIDYLSLMETIFDENYEMADVYIENIASLPTLEDEDILSDIDRQLEEKGDINSIDVFEDFDEIDKYEPKNEKVEEKQKDFFDTFFEKND